MSVLLLLGGLLPRPALGAPTDAIEQAMLDELGRLDPGAVADFRQATEARERGDHAAARAALGRVLARQPRFAHALRRLCWVEISEGHRAEGVGLCRKAVEAEPSARNLAALAMALSARVAEARPPEGEINEARTLAEQALSKEPSLDAAREAYCEVALARRDMTEAFRCGESDASFSSPEAHASYLVRYAAQYAEAHGDGRFTSQQRDEMARVLRRAERLAPKSPEPWVLLGMMAAESEDLAGLREATLKLEALAPAQRATFLLRAQLAVAEGSAAEARQILAEGKAKGVVDAETAARFESALSASERPSWLRLILFSLVGWASAFGLLYGGGVWLSGVTLRRAEAAGADATAHPTGRDAQLRRLYRALLWACCLFYYLSLPLVLVSVVAVAALALYAMLAAGFVAIKLVLIVGFVALVTIGAVAKSVFVRPSSEDPGEPLPLDDHPRLKALLEDVARKVGTRPVQAVFLTPGTDLGVYERGGMLAQLRGETERCLVLGVGVLKGLKLGPLRAILAHEYGHFSNEDTAGGGFALAVRRSMMSMGIGLARAGAAAWYNPAWLFFRGFSSAFLRVSQGASRLQEVLADRWAVRCFGAEALEQGLRHVIERSARFDAHVNAALKEVIDEKLPLANLYRFRPEAPPDRQAIRREIDESLRREPSPYDSHPSPERRFAWARALAVPAPEPAGDEGERAWGLFEDRRRIEESLTAEVREQIAARFGVQIPAEGDEEGEEENDEVEQQDVA